MKPHGPIKSAVLAFGSTVVFSATAVAQEQPAQVTVQQQSPPVVQTAPPPPQERETITEKSGPSIGMLTWGAATFGVSYGAAAIAGAVADGERGGELFVPFVGPWTALNDYPSTSGKVFLITDGVFQALGGVLVINAFLSPQTRTVTRTKTAEVQVSPAVSPEFLGLAATGRF